MALCTGKKLVWLQQMKWFLIFCSNWNVNLLLSRAAQALHMQHEFLGSFKCHLQGMINKRPDCCNKSFMLIDTVYSSLSLSE